MGHQVNFYALPDDIAEIETVVRELEPMRVIHSRSNTDATRVVASLGLQENGHRWLFYYLVREGDLQSVVTRHVPAQGYWTVDVLRSPVVEFHSCYFDRKILRRGRVYYVDGFYGEDESWIDKPDSFRRWAKAVLKTTRKCLRKHGSDYVGLKALEWLQHGGGQLVR